ncbi:hypothetical protein NLJ89_g1479 [Agrocybe chaxingu]|uniref:Uncharacterized protein n=1 Tax=Agrocybe chaxingu TaxID=84603 RepID=A0A9W8MZY0_9AGAR|nr:hypothetical protein NLJ89_g1479 [Agrocybe chaxingu]
MASAQTEKPPAWQTDELQDEWPESDPEDGGDNEANNLSYGTQSVSLTIPLSTQIHSTADYDADHTHGSSRSRPVGTFLVREDAAHINLMPKTPGQNKKGLMKNIFTPTPLERMFDPPSPPIPSPSEIQPWDPSPPSRSMATPNSQPSQAEDEIMETDMPNMNSFHGRKASMACQFTFAMPRESLSRTSGPGGGVYPQAQSTPNPPLAPTSAAPLTDPRLRLFQFQYDTYTREHLSALVDSIAVNTPSGTGTTATPTSFTNGLSRVSEVTGTADNASHLRSSKRIKLSPSSDLCGDGVGVRATITRPKLYGKDYVGESHSLMQKIKQARDYSTISTVASGQDRTPSTKNETPSTARSDLNNKSHERRSKHNASPSEPSRRPSFLSVPEQTSNPSTSSGAVTKPSPYSSSSYRQKAAALMEQIKSDVKRQKRVFSGDSEATALPEDTTNSFSSRTGSVKLGTDAKESFRQSHSRRASTSSKSNVSRSRASPRRAHKKLVDESDLVRNLSRISIHEQQQPQPQQAIVNVTLVPPAPLLAHARPEREHPQPARPNLAPPSYPSIRLTTNEDLNRFVSSSTASGTTVTAGSAPSFVKHAGPAHIRTIAPSDIPPLPERFGDMLFDKVMMRWVKSTAGAVMDPETAGHATEASEDPFGDIESLRSDSDSRRGDEEEEGDEEGREEGEEEESETERLRDTSPGPAEMMSRISEHSEVEDEEEMELSNFSTDVSAHVVHVMTGVETDGYDDDETTDSGDEDDIHTVTRQQDIQDIDFDSEFEDSPSRNNSLVHVGGHSHAGARGTPQFLARERRRLFLSVSARHSESWEFDRINDADHQVRTEERQRDANICAAEPEPVALHDAAQWQIAPASVSFSDGKREGPIQGITASGGGSTSIVQSARTKRIADMMHALEDSDLDEDDSPSKTSSSGRPEELQPLSHRRPTGASGPSSGKSKSPAKSKSSESPRRVFSRSYTHRPSSTSPASGQRSFSKANSSANKANATFLTECSFGVAHDRLVEVITDAQPFEPHWEELSSIDLSGAKLESVARLKEFLPRLGALCL